MTDPFVGEIRINAFDYAPSEWASCNGQQININQNAALYSLLGVNFGGDKKTYFNLPDMRGRTPVGYYTNPGTINTLSRYNLGTAGGTETVTLTTAQIPAHNHGWAVSTTTANTLVPKANVYANGTDAIFSDLTGAAAPNLVALNPKIMADAGGSQPHNNLQPYLVLNFCIALTGVFPPRPW